MPLFPPVPPFALRSITGPTESENFMGRGQLDLEYLFGLHAKHAPARTGQLRVLDFGCGCGRLSRHLTADWIKAFASDMNPDLVAWCRDNLPAVDTRKNEGLPPLPFEPSSIDFAYALSVFTHLPEDVAAEWFEDLARVLAPGGILIATTHGYPALVTIKWSKVHQDMIGITQQKAADLIEQLPRERLIFLPYDDALTRQTHATTAYGNAFMDIERVGRLWENSFELLEHVPGGRQRDWQDALVLRKK